MTITRADVADLQPGDVVEISAAKWPEGTVVRGPLRLDGDTLFCAGEYVRHYDGSPPHAGATQTLTVVSRAPRPLYVNHPTRTEPVLGDVANPGDGSSSVAFRTVSGWIWPNGTTARLGDHGLRLLVDGELGQVVQ